MAIYSGVADEADKNAIYSQVLNLDSPAWNQIATPYYNNYVIFAMSQAGHPQDAMTFARNYWGGMIQEGATSFWESYDPKWEKKDSHFHLNADDGTGYFVSLCHGWSTGVTNWLTEEVLGVKSTAGGFKECEIHPHMCDLTYVGGQVPTPSGQIVCLVYKLANGYTMHLEIPKGIQTAKVWLDDKRATVVHGPKALPGSNQGELILGPGSYDLKS
jgi:hypothetical protein